MSLPMPVPFVISTYSNQGDLWRVGECATSVGDRVSNGCKRALVSSSPTVRVSMVEQVCLAYRPLMVYFIHVNGAVDPSVFQRVREQDTNLVEGLQL